MVEKLEMTTELLKHEKIVELQRIFSKLENEITRTLSTDDWSSHNCFQVKMDLFEILLLEQAIIFFQNAIYQKESQKLQELLNADQETERTCAHSDQS